MMNILGYGLDDLKQSNGYHTAVEIVNQPALWEKIYNNFIDNEELIRFFKKIGDVSDYNIILTGAGSSAFIGEVLEGAFIQYLSPHSRAVPTTTIVTYPALYFPNDRPTLMVSFARSGDSPESVASMVLANKVCNEIRHLVVTCNADGKMVKELNSSRDCLFVLPEEAHDKGLAMTGSFTGMLLGGYLFARFSEIKYLKREIKVLVEYGNEIIQNFKKLSDLDFSRCIFIGSGALLGIARESHLKVQELTNGKIMCNYYSYLGLRHGPKVVIDPETLVVFLISNEHYVQRYEKDLINDMINESLGFRKIGISDHFGSGLDIDFHLNLSSGDTPLDIYLYALVSTLPAQILGFFKSINLGYSPDSPSENGTISRVVKGFEIYNYNCIIP